MKGTRKPKLVLIDAHALIHRAYHALPPMNARDGRPTNAVYGFCTMLLKVFTTLKPTHVVAAFDRKGPTFRHKAFAEYKAHRKAADQELVAQFDTVRDVLKAFSIPVVDKQGFEADDIIGTLVTTLDGNIKKLIVTGDLDTLQLVDAATSVFTLKRGITDTILYTPELVWEKYGFAPELLADYKGLRGDPSDNIPGVAGIGDKTARELVATLGPIEKIYEHLDDLPARARTRLTGHKKDAVFSRRLATISRDVPLSFTLAQAVLEDFDPNAVHDIFEQLDFRSLLNKIPKSSRGVVQPSLLAAARPATADAITLPPYYHLVEGAAEQKKLIAQLHKEKLMAIDTETDRLGARTSPIVGLSVAVRRGKHIEAYYVPVSRRTVGVWKELLENPQVAKVGHNLKYDHEVFAQSGIDLQPVVFDSMIASYLLHPDSRQHNLDGLALQELGHRCIPITDLIGDGKDQRTMSAVPLPALARYAAEDADISLRLFEALAPRLKTEGLTRVMDEIEVPLIPVLSHMEQAGIKVDRQRLKHLQRTTARRLEQLTKDIWQAAGSSFNINSTQQLRTVLFETLKLPTADLKRTQSGFSTAASELAKLRGQHAIIELLEEYRELAKLQSTYIETLPTLINPDTGRIHTSFNQVVAASGRLSSQDPNLQNIPVRTAAGEEIRAAFVAEDKHVLVKADYSQLELRIAAHLSQDEKMLDTFRAEEDIHTATAAWVLGKDPHEVLAKERRDAKALNFGVLYGMGAQSFAQTSGVSVEEARSFIERYREQYTGLMAYRERILEQAEALGYVETLFGRKRYVEELRSNAPAIRAQAERAAFNFPMQGTEADIIKKAMIELYRYMVEHYPKARLVLTVHDELVCEVPRAEQKKFAHDMKRIMEGVCTLDVPLDVDVAAGKNWRDMEPLGISNS